LIEPSAPQVTAVVVSSPFLGFGTPVPPVKAALGKVASLLAPRLSMPNGLQISDLTSDAGKQAERKKDTLCFDIATARWFTEASKAQREVEQGASRITAPTLWLIGGADVIANPAQSRKVAASMPNSTVKVFEGYKHEVFNETERTKVFADLTGFLDSIK
jgi:alpha-beta hydrolase superfamily lysophospholipase